MVKQVRPDPSRWSIGGGSRLGVAMKQPLFKYGLIFLVSCAPSSSCGSCRREVQTEDRPLSAFDAASPTPEARRDDTELEPTVVPSEPALTQDLSFELGDAEFFGGDQIQIKSLRGDRPALEVGGRYEVRGRYRLQSLQEASILFSFTARQKGDGVADLGPRSTTILRKGEGDFVLSVQAPYPGYPHVTFYRTDTRRPFGGVYFGSGQWLLRKKGRHYEDPQNGPSLGQ